MGIFSNLKQRALEFVWKIAYKKGAKAAAGAIIAYISTLPLEQYGVSISFQEAALIAGITGLIEFGRNVLKHRFGVEGI